MNINTDVAFVTGVTHKVCQDYARKGPGYILLSDGCSSSPDSDFGSRMLVKATENLLQLKKPRALVPALELNARDAIVLAGHDVDNMKLQAECLDATLMLAHYQNDLVEGPSRSVLEVPGYLTIRVFGDGYVFLKLRDGSIVVHEIVFPSNYPFYLNYLRDDDRLKLISQTYFDAKSFKTVTKHTFGPNFTEPKVEKVEYAFGEDNCELDLSREVGNVDIVALMSDGVGSFYEKTTNKIIPAIDVIKELCAFKGTAGEAVSRRLNAFLRDAAKKNWAHADDVSLGAIFIGE